MKRGVLIGFCVIISAVIFVFAFMETTGKKNFLIQYENPFKTIAESVTKDEPLPKLENPRIVVKKPFASTI